VILGFIDRVYCYIRRLIQFLNLETTAANRDKSKTKFFNHYFNSAFNKPSQLIINLVATQELKNSLNSFTINEADVFEALSQLDTSKAVDIDGIGPEALKHCATSCSCSLCQLFNLSLSAGSNPQQWKAHIIIY